MTMRPDYDRHSPFTDMLAEALARAADEVAEVNRANGWYDDERTFGEDVALLHSEVSEMLEEYRRFHHTETRFDESSGPIPKPIGVGSECADVLIRLLDTCHRYGIDLGLEYRRKIAYNRTRGYKHGGKAL